MEYTVLGRTGLRVSRVGFGGGGIGQVWGPTTEAESVRAVHRALDLGVNFFDVAPSYGHGKAEEVLGIALQGRRAAAIVATKVRLAAEEMDDINGHDDATSAQQLFHVAVAETNDEACHGP
jgi:aryl-alcohol dehydrogenase-like predicted oxidoreductase